MRIVRTTAILALLSLFSIGASRCTPTGGEIQLDHAIEFDGLDSARVMKLVPT